MDANASPPRAIYWFWFTRLVLAGSIWATALGFMAALVAIVAKHIRDETAPTISGGVAATLAVIAAAVLIGWALKAGRAGKLVIEDDRVYLPRAPVPPWCFLPPHELVYQQVKRFGTGTVRTRSGSATALIFEVLDDAPGGRPRRYRLNLIWYRDQQAIEQALIRAIGRRPERLQSTTLGNVRFSERK